MILFFSDKKGLHMSEEEKKKKSHPVLKAVGVTAAAGAAAYAGVSYYIFRETFDMDKSRYMPEQRPVYNAKELSEWISAASRKDEFVNSFDGLAMHALVVEAHPESHDWIILMHDYHSCARDMLSYMKLCEGLGLNILAPDSRGCGASEGRYTGLGWLEHYDLISWINWLCEKDRDSRIILLGKGMGANAVMNALGDYIPKNVVGAVEIGGYSSLRKEMIYIINKNAKYASGATVPCIDFYVKQLLHFSLYDVDTLRQLSLARVPVLFVHGGKDEVVPSGMAEECMAACASEKKILTIADAGHDDLEGREEFDQGLSGFIKELFEPSNNA